MRWRKRESLPVLRTKKCYPLKVALCGTQNHEVIEDYDMRQAAKNVIETQVQWRECEARKSRRTARKVQQGIDSSRSHKDRTNGREAS